MIIRFFFTPSPVDASICRISRRDLVGREAAGGQNNRISSVQSMDSSIGRRTLRVEEVLITIRMEVRRPERHTISMDRRRRKSRHLTIPIVTYMRVSEPIRSRPVEDIAETLLHISPFKSQRYFVIGIQ